MLNYVRQLFKIRVVFTRFISETKSVITNLFRISDTSNSLADSCWLGRVKGAGAGAEAGAGAGG